MELRGFAVQPRKCTTSLSIISSDSIQCQIIFGNRAGNIACKERRVISRTRWFQGAIACLSRAHSLRIDSDWRHLNSFSRWLYEPVHTRRKEIASRPIWDRLKSCSVTAVSEGNSSFDSDAPGPGAAKRAGRGGRPERREQLAAGASKSATRAQPEKPRRVAAPLAGAIRPRRAAPQLIFPSMRSAGLAKFSHSPATRADSAADYYYPAGGAPAN